MKLDLKVGMYIRYIPTIGEYTQKISKITNIKNCMLDMCYTLDNKEEVYSSHFDDIIKASDKLIDVIECGDYVNGKKVIEKWEEPFGEFVGQIFIKLEGEETIPTLRNIETIVTKEVFEQMSYKVGD